MGSPAELRRRPAVRGSGTHRGSGTRGSSGTRRGSGARGSDGGDCRRGLRAALAASRDRGWDRGASAVELAVLGFVIIFASMLIIEYGMWFDARHAALAAAQQGDLVARENASTNPQTWVSLAETATDSYYRGLDTSVLSGFLAKASPGLQPDTVSVQVTGSLNGVISLPIKVTVTGPIECFRTQASQGMACS